MTVLYEAVDYENASNAGTCEEKKLDKLNNRSKTCMEQTHKAMSQQSPCQFEKTKNSERHSIKAWLREPLQAGSHEKTQIFFHIARRCLQGGSINVDFSSLGSRASGFSEGELQGQRKNMASWGIMMINVCSQRTRTWLVVCPFTFSLKGSLSHKTHWLRCQKYLGGTLSNIQSLSSDATQTNKPQNSVTRLCNYPLYSRQLALHCATCKRHVRLWKPWVAQQTKNDLAETCTKIGFDLIWFTHHTTLLKSDLTWFTPTVRTVCHSSAILVDQSH